MSQAEGPGASPELPRLKGRGRIAPAGAAAVAAAPRRPWGPSLKRLGVAALVVGALAGIWSFRGRMRDAAPLLAHKIELELSGLFDAFGKLVAGAKGPGGGPGGATGTTGPIPGGFRPGGPELPAGSVRVAGPNGQVITVGDLVADLRPGSRFRLEGGALELVEGGVLLRLPRAGARVTMRGGFELAGGAGLAEVRIDPDASGTVDALGEEVRIRGPSGAETRVPPLGRWSFPEPDSETYPEAEAETFLKRSAWLAAGKGGNARQVAQELARRSLENSRGTEREGLARHLLELATAWTAPPAGRSSGSF